VYAGLKKAENIEMNCDSYSKDWSPYWRAVVVSGTEFARELMVFDARAVRFIASLRIQLE
jgi:hypothetical protein